MKHPYKTGIFTLILFSALVLSSQFAIAWDHEGPGGGGPTIIAKNCLHNGIPYATVGINQNCPVSEVLNDQILVPMSAGDSDIGHSLHPDDHNCIFSEEDLPDWP